MNTIEPSAAWRSEDGSGNHGVLAGVRVLDLSRVLAGPMATQMMADQGASVLKVEAPSGDETRGWGPPFIDNDEQGRGAKNVSGTSSAYYSGMNHSKDNICLDLQTDAGRNVLGHLLAAADIVVENFKRGTMARWGFNYETVLAQRNPALIYTRITGYGVDGPMGGQPGYDAVLQSFGGLMSINGYPDRNPLRVGVPIVDHVAANMAFSGTLLAYIDRLRSGTGQLVDITLLDAVVSILHPHSGNWIVGGDVPQRSGDNHPSIVPYQVFRAADGDVFVSATNNRQFVSLLGVLDLANLADDERFVDNRQRNAHRSEIVELLAARIVGFARDDLVARLDAVGVASSPVNTVDEALTHAQVRHRGLFLETDAYRGIGVPLTLGRSPSTPPRSAAARGEHTAEVLTRMGYTSDDIDNLRTDGVLG